MLSLNISLLRLTTFVLICSELLEIFWKRIDKLILRQNQLYFRYFPFNFNIWKFSQASRPALLQTTAFSASTIAYGQFREPNAHDTRSTYRSSAPGTSRSSAYGNTEHAGRRRGCVRGRPIKQSVSTRFHYDYCNAQQCNKYRYPPRTSESIYNERTNDTDTQNHFGRLLWGSQMLVN